MSGEKLVKNYEFKGKIFPDSTETGKINSFKLINGVVGFEGIWNY